MPWNPQELSSSSAPPIFGRERSWSLTSQAPIVDTLHEAHEHLNLDQALHPRHRHILQSSLPAKQALEQEPDQPLVHHASPHLAALQHRLQNLLVDQAPHRHHRDQSQRMPLPPDLNCLHCLHLASAWKRRTPYHTYLDHSPFRGALQ